MEELMNHLLKLIESDDSRFAFEYGNTDEMCIYDKETDKAYMLYLNERKPVKWYVVYDEMGDIFETTEQSEMFVWFDNNQNVDVMYRTEIR